MPVSSMSLSSFPSMSEARRPSWTQLPSSGSEGATLDLMRTGAATDASTSTGSPVSSATQTLAATTRASAKAPATRAAEGTPTHPAEANAEDEEDTCEANTLQSASISSRIDGIRACLEARLGTQKFQKLYSTLSLDGGHLAAAVVN